MGGQLSSATKTERATWCSIKELEETLSRETLFFGFGLHHLVRMPLLGLLSLPRPFLDCHVWLTQSAATRMGVHPSLESPAVSGYIIAEPCWAGRMALCACHWMWLWVRLSGGWEATVKGFLPGLLQRWQEEAESEVLESALMWLCENCILFSHHTLCWWTALLAYILDVLCIA